MTKAARKGGGLTFPSEKVVKLDSFKKRKIVEPIVNCGINWVHSNLFGKLTNNCGLGVFSKEKIEKGSILVVYGGRVVTAAQLEKLPPSHQAYSCQIDTCLFLIPPRFSDVGVGELINHSCAPNSGFLDSIQVVAIRDILEGEEITLDYGTCISTNSGAFEMNCQCGSEACRGVITGEDWQLKSIQADLFEFFQPYLKRKILKRRHKTHTERD